MDVCCWQISGQSRGGQKCIFVKTRDCDFCFFYLNEALPPPSHINKFNLKKHCEIVSRSLTTLSGAQFDKCNNTCLHKIDIATLDSWALRHGNFLELYTGKENFIHIPFIKSKLLQLNPCHGFLVTSKQWNKEHHLCKNFIPSAINPAVQSCIVHQFYSSFMSHHSNSIWILCWHLTF